MSSLEYKFTEEQLEEYIHKYCTDFTELAAAGRFDPIHGRDVEIDQVILILLQKGRKNAMLQAPAGVGKTALCVGLAQTVVKGDVPEYLKDCRVLEVDLAAMAAGTSSISEFQGRIVPLLKAVSERYYSEDHPKFILFFDEIHQLMPKCSGSSYAGLSEVMKPYLTAGTLHIIGATTKDEYRQYVAVDPAMDRRFQKVNLSIPDNNGTYKILQALRGSYTKHHKVEVSDETCKLIIKLTGEHIRKRNNPDKSIMTMDAALAYHVKEFGTGGNLKNDAVYVMVSKDTGIHPKALYMDEDEINHGFEEEDGGGIEENPVSEDQEDI